MIYFVDPLKIAQTELENLFERDRDIARERETIHARIFELQTIIKFLAGLERSDAKALVHQNKQAPDTIPSAQDSSEAHRSGLYYLGIQINKLREAFHGQSIPDAATQLLKLHGKPLSEAQLVEGLAMGGVTLSEQTPVRNLRFALLKKEQSPGIVTRSGAYCWALKEWKLPAEPSKSKTSEDEKKLQYSQKAKRSLALARERGIKLGRPAMFPLETKKEAVQAVLSGEPIGKVCVRFGVHRNSLVKWRARYQEELQKIPGNVVHFPR